MEYCNRLGLGRCMVANLYKGALSRGCLVVVIALCMNYCVIDELFSTTHPDKGAVRISTEWTSLSSDAVKPTVYQLRIDDTIQSERKDRIVFKHLLSDGAYSLLEDGAGGEFSGTIVDWTEVDNGDITIT